MFAYLHFRWKLSQLERGRKKTAASYEKDIVRARNRRANGDEIYEIESNAQHEDRMFDEEVYRLHTRYWAAPGSEDTELGVLMELEVGHGEAKVYRRVQA